MASTKLNPIYAAVEAHQYNRAIKLASALPESNVLGKALLAHAYVRSGQRHLALITLSRTLGEEFYELQHELKFDLESTLERYQASSGVSTATATTATADPTNALSTKKGKKGKKKPPVAPSKQQQASSSDKILDDMDLIDQLNTSPSLPEKLDAFPPPERAIPDEVTLATFAVSLQSLKLPLTSYQMYSWAAAAAPNEVSLRKTFTSGLGVLAAPAKWNAESQARMEAHVLSHMQTVALQYARYLTSVGGTPELPTAWAAQVALWQLEWLPEDEQRRQILPRLAESIVKRSVEGEKENGTFSAETRLLGLRALEQQSKWEDMLSFLEDAPLNDDGSQEEPVNLRETDTGLTKTQVLRERASLMKKLKRYEEARALYVKLLTDQPDDWSSWIGHMESSILDGSLDTTATFVEKFLKEQENRPYQLRGPHLMLVEIAAEKLRGSSTDDSIHSLGSAIRSYSETFAPQAACAFSDVEMYVNMIVRVDEEATNEVLLSLLDFAETMRSNSRSCVGGDEADGDKIQQSKLRAYIFAVKLTHKILAVRKDLVERYLPDWKELVAEWQSSLSIRASCGGEEVGNCDVLNWSW